MSIRFSRITIEENNVSTQFLVSGCPQQSEDLKGWTAFEDFMKGVQKGSSVIAHIETFLYGEDEQYDATPEEVAYMYKRIEMRPDFIEKRTVKCNDDYLVICDGI